MNRLKPYLLISFTVAVFICCGSSDSSSDNDNDGVTPPQQCLAPTALSVTLLNGNTVALEWGAMNGETQWKYVLQSQGMGDPTTEGEDTTTNPLTLTDLNPSSSYEFYIRAVCTDNNLSPWAGPVSFTTTVPEGYVKVWEDHFDGPTINP